MHLPPHPNQDREGEETYMTPPKPAMQNIPYRTSEGSRIRDCFVPPADPPSLDYAQLERKLLSRFAAFQEKVAP
jgi:DNA polymerase I-like protein with 3'-5' exonuclease and polymerase domains